MVARVRLDALHIIQARGKWYVYRRATRESLIKGFNGSRDELLREMSKPDFIATYNRPRKRREPASDFSSDTLGGFVNWFTNGDIDRTADERKAEDRFGADGYPKWKKLAAATRQDYLEAFEYLRNEFDIPLADITQPDLYDLRDKCANQKWPRFADQMIAALSSMFRQAVKRGKMTINPCRDMDKAHEADPNANREWFSDEWLAALDRAPMEIKIALMLARYGGLRGQSIVAVGWKQYRPHNLTGMGFHFVTRKNKNGVFVPAMQELQDFLATLTRSSTLIAVRYNGAPWASEKDLQTRVSHWLRDREREGLVGAGTTLHGLRVSYAAWWKRNGANNSEVADLLGDKSERMGAHYTRHVDSEANVIRAFERVKDQKVNVFVKHE
jgi:site-specific recombinase XerD